MNGFEPTKPRIKKRYDRNAEKWRDISEPLLYPDQYVHHMMIQVLEPIFMRGMDYYCCGSIKGRGAIFGVNAIKSWMKKDYKGTRWCGEFDIRHFYNELSPSVVIDRMKELIKDHRTIDLAERCLKYGVLIGAYFSQWFANTVLQKLDVAIRKTGISHYIRYIDNFTIFSKDKRSLKKAKRVIEKWLELHKLHLKSNWQIFKVPYKCSLKTRLPNALGYRYGRTFTLIRKHRLLSIKRQIKSYYRNRENVTFKFAASLLSRIGGLKHCNNSNIFKNIVPKGLQKALKIIIKRHQRRELTEWNIYLERYLETVKNI